MANDQARTKLRFLLSTQLDEMLVGETTSSSSIYLEGSFRSQKDITCILLFGVTNWKDIPQVASPCEQLSAETGDA